MKILAIESSANTASVCIAEDTTPLCEYTLNIGQTHSETLLPMIDEAMKKLDLSISDIDLFACAAGPGSFTGVRIAVSTIKGLSFGSSKPCCAVSTLHSLAYNLVGYSGIIVPLINARRNQAYAAIFECKDGILTRITEDQLLKLEELGEMLKKYESDEECPAIYFCGDAVDIANDIIYNTKVRYTQRKLLMPDAYSTAVIAMQMYEDGEAKTDIEISAEYIRPSQAERELLGDKA